MILVDTSIWIDHLRQDSPELAKLLERGDVLGHPWVTGEIALGQLRNRDEVLSLLQQLPQAPIATSLELLRFIDSADLSGKGIGYVDVQLLAAARLAGATLWTSDRRLAEAARLLGVVDPPPAQ